MRRRTARSTTNDRLKAELRTDNGARTFGGGASSGLPGTSGGPRAFDGCASGGPRAFVRSPAFRRNRVWLSASACTRAVTLALMISLAASCGGGSPASGRDALLRLDVDTADVQLGKAFPLTVVRVWTNDLVAAEWSDRALAPLETHLDARTRREDDGRIEETLRFRCWAFAPGDVAVAGAAFTVTPAGGGDERTISTRPLRLHVHATLDPAAPGPPEYPADLLAPPSRWFLWTAVSALALAAAFTATRRLRRPRPVAPPDAEAPAGPPPPGPHERALADLRSLRDALAQADDSFHVRVSAVVRTYIEERFDVHAPEMTTEEFVQSPRASEMLAPAHWTLLSGFLSRCDMVKFALQPSGAADRVRLLDEAERFVRETAPREAAA